MKIISIKGGLGNQLFQYAHGRSLELGGKKIAFDISFYRGNKAEIDTIRNFKLYHFNIETKIAFLSYRRPLTSFIDKILRKIGLKEYGFYQSEKYFTGIEKDIRKEFTLKEPLCYDGNEMSDKIRTANNGVSLHIRRGDYENDPATNKYWGTCSPEYYSNALQYITSKIGRNIHIFIFSDDIDWVKRNMHFEYPVTYVSSPEIKDYEELVLMSQCDHHIIANSSLSWWGAWLDPNDDKIVVAPKRWTLKDEKSYKDIIPPSWIRI